MSDRNDRFPLDCLAIGAHPDDVELFAGGTLALAAKSGRRVGLLDLTHGERATRGSAIQRHEEACEAAQLLGITIRESLDLGDGDLMNNQENRSQLVAAIRRLKPHLIFTHWHEDRHPDHRRAYELVRDAAFFANVRGCPGEGRRWEVRGLVFFLGNMLKPGLSVDWVVDISNAFEVKCSALKAYHSQFLTTKDDPKPTYIASQAYWEEFERRSQSWGHCIGAEHGEPFMLDRPAHAAHPFIQLLR